MHLKEMENTRLPLGNETFEYWNSLKEKEKARLHQEYMQYHINLWKYASKSYCLNIELELYEHFYKPFFYKLEPQERKVNQPSQFN